MNISEMSTSREDFLILVEKVQGEPQLKLHGENLEKVFSTIGEKNVSIISIVGTSPQQKNYLLGYLILYLKTLQDSTGVPNPLSGTLHGFLWKEECRPSEDISATWIFKTPFIIKTDSGQEVAIILLYTQFPSESSSASDKILDSIVGLNIFISSTCIIDSFRQLPQKLIKRIDSFIKYGLLGVGLGNSSKSFQNLSLFIRDWTYPADFPYGEEGGEKYLTKIFSQSVDSKKVRENIEKHFENFNCHLAPFPGSRAVSADFAGAVQDLEPIYCKTIENFIRSFAHDNLVPSKIHGELVTSTSIEPVVESFIRALNYGSSPKSPFSSIPAQPVIATSPNQLSPTTKRSRSSKKKQSSSKNANKDRKNTEVQNGVELETEIPANSAQPTSRKSDEPAFSHEKVVKKALEKFKGSFTAGILESGSEYTFPETVSTVYKNAVKLSRETLKKEIKKLNTEVEDKSLSKTLEKKLKKDAEQDLESFNAKNETKKSRFIDEIVASYVGKYNTLMSSSSSHSGESQKEKALERKSTQTIENLKSDLVEKFSLAGESKNEVFQELERKLNAEYSKLLATKQKEAEPSQEFMQSSFDDAISEYRRTMNGLLQNENAAFGSKSLEIWHMETREKSFRKLKSRIGSNNNPFLNQLAAAVEGAFQEIKKKHDALQENLKLKANDLIQNYEQQYSYELKENESELMTEGLHAKHKERVEDIQVDFQKKCGYPEGSRQLNSCTETLSQKLNFLFSNHVKVLTKLKKERESNIENAIEGALRFYRKEMEELLKINYFLDDEDFENGNQNILEKSTKTYQDALAAYSIPFAEAHPAEKLKLKLSKDYREYKLQNGQKRNLSFSETKNLVTECVKIYNFSVSKGMVLVWNKETLEKLHRESLQEAISKLKADCVKKNDDDFLSPFLEELEYEIGGAFEEIEQMYEFKSSAEADTINAALAKGREVYNDEMDKHFKNHEFIRPNVLEDLHKEVSARAIKICFENNAFLKDSNKLQLQEGMNLIFEKYKQQNDMNLETEPAIGIDLGTTYSCVAIYAKGKVHIIPNGIGKNTTPSYVAFTKNGKETIGEPAKSRAYENPEDTIFDAKRIIGRRFNDPNLQDDMKLWPFTVVNDFGVPKILAGGKKLHPEEISAKLLKELKKDAERYLQRDVKKAVITVPAYFTDGQRQATKDAGLMAGLEVLNVQTEPTAAAIAYKLQHSEGKDRNVLIFDLGGGTFDVAVLKMSKGNIEVLAVDGDTHLGGEDFDKNMMQYCAQEFKNKHKIDLFEGKDSENKQTKDEARRRLKRLQGECERKKIELATSIAAVVTVDRMHGKTDLSVTVSRETFNKLNETLFKKTIEVVDKALLAAKVSKSKIDDIVLVGGSTRIPKVQEMLGTHFGGKALDHYINPDEAVAYGAAMTAAYMNGTIAKNSMDFNKIQDVTPMSIGVEVYGGGFSVIIPKSTKTPVKLMERYKTAHNNQTSVQITIYQGENPIAVHNQHLGDFYLNGIPPRAAEVENIDVEMIINSQGILHVSAVSSSTGHKNVSIIENKFRMGSGAIQRFLDEAPAEC